MSWMADEKSEFDALVDLHEDVKFFKIHNSVDPLAAFAKANEKKEKKFNRTSKPSESLNLSSTATCAYALANYQDLWDEYGKKYKFFSLEEYWKHIADGLTSSLIPDNELPDEFSILNILSLSKGIITKINEKRLKANPESPLVVLDDGILAIIKALCEEFSVQGVLIC